VRKVPNLQGDVGPFCYDMHHQRDTLDLTPQRNPVPDHTKPTPMPHPIIEINELSQSVIDYLLVLSPKSLVSLACTHRALEEQVLAALWSEQSSLCTLVRSTLPSGVLSHSLPLPEVWDTV
jgi:hypothetical protein